ncbi:tetratricopeptide repeat protein [Lewinella sp. LCG006]|uniref:tetratricopeptide repeat protein n=1 Tax=Lewinella sp. LCG006 TaxID=3231911 RepID=UPI0034609028
MNLFDKYRTNNINEDELGEITQQLVKQKFDLELRQKMTHRLREEYGITRDGASGGRVVPMKIMRWSLSVAAALLIGVVAWQVVGDQSPTYQSLTKEYLAAHYPNNELRKGATDISELRGAAIAAYNEEDFETSARLREEIVKLPEANTEDYFFLGISYLYQDPPQGELAIEPLQKAVADPTGTGLIREETEWYLTLAYVEAGRFTAARKLLHKRIRSGGWNASKASDLLQSLPEEE